MIRAQSVRRKTHMKDLPRTASIPKFLSPTEILKVKEVKARDPKLGWTEAVEKVVYDSVNVSEILSR